MPTSSHKGAVAKVPFSHFNSFPQYLQCVTPCSNLPKLLLQCGHFHQLMYNTNQTINNGIVIAKAISFGKTLLKMDAKRIRIINETNKILFF